MATLKLGLAQLRPAWGDKRATTGIVTDALRRAAAEGIELLAFSETFLSGYPFWVCRTNGAAYEDARQQRAYAQFLEAAVEIDGPEIAAIAEAARDCGVSLYLGVNERGSRAGRGTVWCTLVTIDARRGVLGAHRKLMPTYDERLCWGMGDARDLRAHAFGRFRVGGLNCWENWMPYARAALYEDGEDIHISAWPGNAGVTNGLQHTVAREGRVWSACVCGLLSLADVPGDFEFHRELAEAGTDVIFAGGSMLVSPLGGVVAEIPPNTAGIVGYEVDSETLGRARQNFDPAGHYARPDVFGLTVHRQRL